MTTDTKQMTNTLIVLLRWAKSLDEEVTWRSVATALDPVYGFDMTLRDVMEVLLHTYEEALNEPRFQLRNGRHRAQELLLAPITGHYAVEMFGARSVDAKYSVEDFYNAMVKYVVSELRITNVSWCKEVLLGPTARAGTVAKIIGSASP